MNWLRGLARQTLAVSEHTRPHLVFEVEIDGRSHETRSDFPAYRKPKLCVWTGSNALRPSSTNPDRDIPFGDLGPVGLYALLPLGGQNHGLGLYCRYLRGGGELNAAREFFRALWLACGS